MVRVAFLHGQENARLDGRFSMTERQSRILRVRERQGRLRRVHGHIPVARRMLGPRISFAAWRRSAGCRPIALRENLLDDPERFGAGRDTAVNREVLHHLDDLLTGAAVLEPQLDVGGELGEPVLGADDRHGYEATFSPRDGRVAPDLTETGARYQGLKFLREIILRRKGLLQPRFAEKVDAHAFADFDAVIHDGIVLQMLMCEVRIR
jgi:hypothetical protein